MSFHFAVCTHDSLVVLDGFALFCARLFIPSFDSIYIEKSAPKMCCVPVYHHGPLLYQRKACTTVYNGFLNSAVITNVPTISAVVLVIVAVIVAVTAAAAAIALHSEWILFDMPFHYLYHWYDFLSIVQLALVFSKCFAHLPIWSVKHHHHFKAMPSTTDCEGDSPAILFSIYVKYTTVMLVVYHVHVLTMPLLFAHRTIPFPPALCHHERINEPRSVAHHQFRPCTCMVWEMCCASVCVWSPFSA